MTQGKQKKEVLLQVEPRYTHWSAPCSSLAEGIIILSSGRVNFAPPFFFLRLGHGGSIQRFQFCSIWVFTLLQLFSSVDLVVNSMVIFGLLAIEGVFSHLSVATAAEPPCQAVVQNRDALPVSSSLVTLVPQDLQKLQRFLQYFQGPVWWHSARKAMVDGVHLNSVIGTRCIPHFMAISRKDMCYKRILGGQVAVGSTAQTTSALSTSAQEFLCITWPKSVAPRSLRNFDPGPSLCSDQAQTELAPIVSGKEEYGHLGQSFHRRYYNVIIAQCKFP